MARLVFVDDMGGSLAALGAAMARLEGAPGFEEAVARTTTPVEILPVVGQVLTEIGLHLTPVVRPFVPDLIRHAEGDLVVSLGTLRVDGADQHWPLCLAAPDAHPLVVRSTARTTRDQIARLVATSGLAPTPRSAG